MNLEVKVALFEIFNTWGCDYTEGTLVTEPVHKVWQSLNVIIDPETRNHISEEFFDNHLEGIPFSIKSITM